MRILAIDTSTSVAGVALMEDDVMVCEYDLRTARTHSQRLMPMVDQALNIAEWERESIDVLAAVTGPGSFTGLRIGIATVKGMALALNKPVVGVGTLETLAYGLPYAKGILLPLCDARRGQVYAAAYDFSDGTLKEIIPPDALALADMMANPVLEQAEKIICCGDGAWANKAELEKYPNVCFAPVSAGMQRGACAAALAMEKVKQGKVCTARELQAGYYRASQAEQARAKK